MPVLKRRASIRYGVSAASFLAAVVLHFLLGATWFSDGSLFLLFFFPVILSSWLGGRGPGLVTTAIGAFAVNFLAIHAGPGAESPDQIGSVAEFLQGNVALLLFVTGGVLISLLGGTLHQSESRNAALMRSAIDGVVTLDLHGTIVDFNSAAEQIFGHPRSEVLGRDLASLIVPGTAPQHRSDLLRYLKTNPDRFLGKRIEMTAVHADGTEFPVELSLARLPQEGPPLLAGFVRDIRPRKRLEQQLKRQIQVARLLQQASTLSSTTRSFENVLQNCLDMVCEITGWPVGHIFLPSDDQRTLIGSRIWHVDDPEAHAVLLETVQCEPLRPGEALPGRIWAKGEPEWVANLNEDETFAQHATLWSRLGIRGAFGLPVKIHDEVVAVMEFFTSEDVPPDAEMLVLLGGVGEQLGQVIDRRRREEQLRQAKDAAEAANRAKSEFLANVSHEVRTPMNAVLGMLQVVLSEQLPAQVRENLRTASDSAKTLMALLNDLLDFSRMEAGRFQLESTPFYVRQGITSCVKTLSVKAQEKGLKLSCQIAPDVPERLLGDMRRLQQVILNLAGNAIKFTERGEVNVHVSLLKPGESSLEGDGGGAESAALQLPSMPARLGTDATPTDQLRQRIIWRESTSFPGRTADSANGLTAPRITDSARITDSPRPTTDSPRSMETPRITDSPRNSDVMLHITVSDTGIGIGPDDQARIFEPFTQVDSSSTRRHAGTGLGLTICCELIRRMGGVMWVESELGRGSRFHCTARFGVPAAQRLAASSSDTAWFDEMITVTPHPLRVLLAEDTPANQKVVSTILLKRGHHVEIARDGRETIERVRREEFDIVLMDVQMPNIDGYQATAAIRRLESPERAQVPIIAITAHAMSGDRDRCLAAGMDDYVPKPIDATELIHTIERVAEERREEATMKLPTTVEPSLNATAIPPQTADSETHDNVVNREAAIRRLGGDERLFDDLVRFFDEDMPGLIDQIHDGLRTGNLEQTIRAAHTLKGLAANFDAVDATAAAGHVVEIGRSQNLEAMSEALRHLEQELRRLHRALEPYRTPAR